MRLTVVFAPTLLALAATSPVLALDRPEVRAAPVDDDEVTLDGRLDEAAWGGAEWGEDFTQRQPRDGDPPSETTRFAVLRGERALYVGVECLESDPDGIVARRGRLDQSTQSDLVTIDIDARGDGSAAFHFEITAGGGRLDGTRSADGETDRAWDGIWQAEVARDDRGWTAEVVLPLATLRFAAEGDAVALQVRRKIMRLQELDEWARVPRSAGGEIVHYGRLSGLAGLEAPWPIDLAPYTLGGFVHRSQPDPGTLASGYEPRWELGLDAAARLTPSLILTAAVNPDFGHIEADELVLNLSTIETWYAEKRPFFLADGDVLSTPFELVHTRRIGAAVEPPEVPGRWRLDRRPGVARIWEALKLAGEPVRGWTVGALSALTGEESALSHGPYGERLDRLAAPLTHFGVLRLRRDFGDDTSVGLLATTVNRFEPDSYPDDLCPAGGAPADGRCFGDAYVGALDGRFRTADGAWSGEAQAVVGGLAGGPSRTLADGTSLDSGDVGWAAAAAFARSGGHWRGGVDTRVRSAELWVNDLGYESRGNLWSLDGWAGWWTDELGDPFQTFEVDLEVEQGVTLEGWDVGQQYCITAETMLLGNNWFRLDVGYRPDFWDDRELRDGAVLRRPDRGHVELGVSTDYRYPVTLDLWAEATFGAEVWSAYADASIGVKPADTLTLEIAPMIDFSGGEPRRVGVDESGGTRRYLLGTLESSSVGVTLRATWAVTPDLSLQLWGQLFLAAARYGPFFERSVGAGERPAIGPGDLAPAAAPPDDPDFSQTALNASAVLRWEYLPGSVIHVVYTHMQGSDALASDGRLDAGLLGDAARTDLLLVKLGYLWE